MTMPDGTFWAIAAANGLVGYFHKHQASHLAHLAIGNAELNPFLLHLLIGSYRWVYRWLVYLPWAFLVWYGYKTVWWLAVGAWVAGWIFQLVLVKIEMATGLTRSAWAISLVGIPVIPVLIIVMYDLVAPISLAGP